MRIGKSGDIYRADPIGHGVDPDTGRPFEPHIHRVPRKNGPVYKYDLKGNPLDGGSKIPSKDLPAFFKAVWDAMKYMPKVLPILFAPPAMFMEPNAA